MIFSLMLLVGAAASLEGPAVAVATNGRALGASRSTRPHSALLASAAAVTRGSGASSLARGGSGAAAVRARGCAAVAGGAMTHLVLGTHAKPASNYSIDL